MDPYKFKSAQVVWPTRAFDRAGVMRGPSRIVGHHALKKNFKPNTQKMSKSQNNLGNHSK